MKSKFFRTLLVSFGILLICLWAIPQIRESGEIQGHVTDDQGNPLPGVELTIESPNLIGGAQVRICDSNGDYMFRSLSPGMYKVTAKLSGFNTMVREGIWLHVGKTLGVDFKMTQTAVAEEVIVVADIPTVDIKSSKGTSVILTDDILLSIPVSKSYSQLIFLSPGDDFYSPYGGGYGSTSAWQFDGVDVSDPGWGGVSFRPDFNVIKEATVLGLGLPAEYGRFTGAVMTAVSKSGANRFSTLTDFRYNGKIWNSQNWKQVPEDSWYPYYKPAPDYKYETLPYYDIGSQVGGKLIQDRLWFFASGEYDRQPQPVLGRTDQITNNRKLFGKLTYQLNSSNKANVSLLYARQETSGGGSAYWPEDLWLESNYRNYYGNFGWTSILSPSTFLDVKIGAYKYWYTQYPSLGIETPGIRDAGTGMYINNYISYSGTTDYNYDINVQFNHYAPEFIKGSHDIKIGTELALFKIVTESGSPGNEQITYYWGEPLSKSYKEPTLADNYATVFTGFFQDTWSVTKRLNINLGLRYDHYWYRIPVQNVGVVYSNPAFSPRIGFTYDLLGDRKNVVRLHYAHYSENINRNQFYSRFDPRRNAGAIQYSWDSTINDWVELYRISYEPFDSSVDPHASHPWIREISGGFERELFRNASLAINFYNRSIGKSFYYFNVAAEYASTTGINPGPDNKVGTSDDMEEFTVWYETNPGVYKFVVLNPEKGNPEWMTVDPQWYCRGIEVIFNKRFANRWAMQAAYSYTRSKGNTSGAMVSIFDPNYIYNSYGEQGGSYYSQPHQLKVQGNVLLPLDIDLGFTAKAMSGRQGGRPRVSVRTPAGTKSVYVEYPGQFKYDARYDFDMRVQKIFKIGEWKLTAFTDIYNVLNNHDGNNGIYNSYGPYYHLRTSIKNPRIYQIGFRIIR